MAVISITITESEESLLEGIPQFLTLSTNTPATVFYTLDGTDPTTSSLVYLDQITMPRENTVIFKAFATDGYDTCPIITRVFAPDITIVRKAFDTVSGVNSVKKKTIFPYASEGQDGHYVWGTHGPADLIVDKSTVPNIPDGYDGTGAGSFANGTDLPLDNYLIRFSETNFRGERGRGLGTLPTEVTVIRPTPPQASSNINDKMFDPRALVIYQDSREEPLDPNVANINRAAFSLQDANIEKERSGALLQNEGFNKAGATGSFVRSVFNPRDNSTTYYYFDSQALRWIISTEPAQVSPSNQSLSNIVFSSRRPGARYLYKWNLFKRSRII